MHHALYLDEILLNIFDYCYPFESVRRRRRRYTADLATLARTCQTFKEPALDMLWSELVDLSPLARCLSEVCLSWGNRYSISRPLNEAEWTTLRGYTCRVRNILGFSSFHGSLDDSSIQLVFNPPFAEPLFPNLQSLCWRDMTKLPPAHVAVQTLTSLDLNLSFSPRATLQFFLEAAADLCPHMRQLRISVSGPHPFDETISRQLCRWASLQVVDCRDVTLNVDAVVHLSSMSTLRFLSFTLSAGLVNHTSRVGSTLVFSNLAYLEIKSDSLSSIMGFLSHIQFIAVEEFIVKFPHYAPEDTLRVYLASVRNACPSDPPVSLKLLNFRAPTSDPGPQVHPSHRLNLDDILPSAAFTNLCGIHVNFNWSVSLTDADLLSLASALPCLKSLIINDTWGWRTDGGITLGGLVQLLRTCPSLYQFCIAINTRTFTQIFEGLDMSFPTRPRLWMNVADSSIEDAYVSALVSVFTELKLDPAACMAWKGSEMENLQGADLARSIWGYVYYEFAHALLERSLVSETQ